MSCSRVGVEYCGSQPGLWIAYHCGSTHLGILDLGSKGMGVSTRLRDRGLGYWFETFCLPLFIFASAADFSPAIVE